VFTMVLVKYILLYICICDHLKCLMQCSAVDFLVKSDSCSLSLVHVFCFLVLFSANSVANKGYVIVVNNNCEL
jgi:hypothetical protein